MQEHSKEYYELEERLSNAESLVNALRNLEIDAIIGEQHVAYVQLKEVADTIRDSRELYRHIVREAPTGIAEVDLNNDSIITANIKLSEYTGYSREELGKLSIQELFSKESLSLLQKQLSDIKNCTITPNQLQYRMRLPTPPRPRRPMQAFAQAPLMHRAEPRSIWRYVGEGA